jgi:hypothetical protein
MEKAPNLTWVGGQMVLTLFSIWWGGGGEEEPFSMPLTEIKTVTQPVANDING